MEHYYQNIHGWFDYEACFQLAIKSCPENGKIVELGCWKGKSSSFLITEAFNSGKKIDISFIDTWAGSSEHTDPASELFDKELAEDPDHIYNIFIDNINKVEYPKNILRMDTFEASKLFDDNSLDFVYIDTAHEYEHVAKEILAWYPKVKVGGYLAGHDIYFPGVNQAVREYSSRHNHVIRLMATAWVSRKVSDAG
jgi:cephalosporin hydroxylase